MPIDMQLDTIGPVDVAVIVFDGNDFNGDVAPALAELHDSGTVRVVDLAFVRRDADGLVSVVEAQDADVADTLAGVAGSQTDLLNDADLDELAGRLEPGTSALVIVWENTWAARMATAVRKSNGRLAMFDRIPHENVLRAFAAVNAD